MSKFINSLLIKLRARQVGKDIYGNRYYEDRAPSGAFSVKKRFVIYNGQVEASKVPGAWYCWLHYQTDSIPKRDSHYEWEIGHEPNLSGTSHAYYPKGHVFSGAKRAKSYGDYESWSGQ